MTKQLLYSLRILYKYRLYTVITLVGLGISITSLWFIANFVTNSYEYDAFHDNSARIYRLTMEVSSGDQTDHYATTGVPPGQVLSNSYSGVTAYVSMKFHHGVSVTANEKKFNESGFFRANREALDVFTFNFITGNKSTCFSDPQSVLLSRHLAEKYFRSVDILNEVVVINKTQYVVKGVFEDWPENTHLDVNALFYTGENTSAVEPQDWFDLEYYTYVLLDSRSKGDDLNSTLDQLANEQVAPIIEGSGIAVKFNAQSLSGLYFEPGLIDDVPKGNTMYVNAIAFAGLLVLLISSLNYINLSLTQSAQRLKEIALKKALGIPAKQLWSQRAIESLLMTALVFLVSAMLILTLSDLYVRYTGFTAINFLSNWPILLLMFFIVFLLGFFGTSYAGASFSFSSTQPTQTTPAVTTFKKTLLGFQFVISAVIIIVTLTMNKQVNFMKNKDLGFTKDQVMMVSLPDDETVKNDLIQLRDRVRNFDAIENASLIGGGALPDEENGKEIFQVAVNGSKQEKVYNIYRIDEEYCKLLNIKFVSGRDFQTERPGDKHNAVIINEALARALNWEKPLGKTIWYGETPRNVIGVVRNFHNKSLHNIMEPIVFIYDEDFPSKLLVKTAAPHAGIVESAWEDIFPDAPFAPAYFDQFLEAKYQKEDYLAKLLGFFSFVSLLLCCMGLFAIFSLNMLQKKNEMNIRKVLGANAFALLKTATRHYLLISVLGIGIAIPIAWYLMKLWLNEFSYRIQLDPFIFIASAFIIMVGICSTLMYHVIKALNVNPAEALRAE